MKKPSVSQLASLLSFLILVGSIVFVLHVWRSTLNQEEHLAMKGADDVHVAALRTAYQRTQTLLHQVNVSSMNLAKILSNISFSFLNDDQVSRSLFLAYKTLFPIVTQISLAQNGGFLLSYLSQSNHSSLSIFSNASSLPKSFSSFPSCCYYSQTIDHDTGTPSGSPVSAYLSPEAARSLNDAISGEFSSVTLGAKLNFPEEPLIIISSSMKNISAVLSLGISVRGLLGMIDNLADRGGSLFFVSEDGQLLKKYSTTRNFVFSLRNGKLSVTSNFSKEISVSCNADAATISLGGTDFELSCASLHLEKNAVLVQIIPALALIEHAHKLGIISYFLLFSVLLMAAIVSAIMFQRIIKHKRRDELLRSSLIKRKEATQQAERKSMNKSLAFASASHDVRTSLAGITGLIELCHAEVHPQSEMEKNLNQMSVCASKLLGIMNSVLDMSKVEAGKMQLEEEEFDMSKLIEESVDLFHVVALKKGLEVIWDPCDGSVMNSSNVKGDSGRLKQIIDNLLSNAIKFTSDGHVVVRSWARRLKLEAPEDQTFDCNFSPVPSLWSCFSVKKADVFDENESVISPAYDNDTMEFVFEVEDTGVGIPKDKWESIFENFVQVRDGHGGTGLGLGIVQSFVRLMGGEISIVEKEMSEKGTCFRFNIFLKSAEASDGRTDAFSSQEDQGALDLKRRSPKAVVPGIHAVFLIQGEETKKILGRWLESLGVKICAVDQWELLIPTLERIIRQKPSTSHICIFDRSVSFSELETSSSSEIQEVVSPPIHHHQHQHHHNRHKKTTSFTGATTHIMIIVDLDFEFYGRNPCLVMNSLLKGVSYNQCRVIWLANSNTPEADISSLKNKEVPCDLLLRKPLHGSRLQAILDLLRRFDQPKDLAENKNAMMLLLAGDPDLSMNIDKPKEVLSDKDKNTVITAKSDTPLSGLKVLVAEDNSVLLRLTLATLTRLGAIVESCGNGKEAVEMIRKLMQEESIRGESSIKCPPFDFICMDCEMPIMNGYEATRQIREDEKQYGFHIPVIALTAHALEDHSVDFLQCGMDFHLMKPLQPDLLVDLINKINKI